MMDDKLRGARYYLEQADAIAVSLEECSTGEAALLSIAAALIAQAEAQRKPQFVRVGHYWICPEHIASIEDTVATLYVYSRGAPSAILRGDDRLAFLAWWNEHADVERLGDTEDAVEVEQ
jgi:hypothetical protein